jgi:amino acid adenylation domain-containing protein
LTIESRYPQGWAPALIHHVLTRAAVEAPSRDAVIDPEKTWSYGFLARAAEEYASTLQRGGLAKGQRVIVDLVPSAEALALFFACSMLGLVYVPTDPSSPDSRVSSIASLATAAAYIGRRQAFHGARSGLASGHLDGGSLILSASRPSGPDSDQTGPLPTDLAYIIFTSGSTGTPKGIMMTHGAVVSVFHGLADHCRLRPVDRVGSIAPLQFDFSILDLGVALTSGAALVLVPNLLPHQPRAFIEYLAQTRVSHMSGVPSIWRPTLAEGPERLAALRDLHTVFYGGEGFSCAEIAALRKSRPGLRVINAFGQSESILCSMRDVEHDENSPRLQPPVGFGFPGIEMVLIGDDNREVTRPGETGELYVGGPCLFSGYWQDEAATQQALRPHPTRPLTGGRMFKSGDLLRIGEDGEYYFAGRRDLQIKLLGNRVEVEEIERCLATHPAVLNAAVLVAKDEDSHGSYLVAIIVPTQRADAAEDSLRTFCADRLPKYMVPRRFMLVDGLPMSINGKLDRQALQVEFCSTQRRG